MFVVSVNISVCYEANGPCAVDLKILENTKLPIPLCDFNQEIPGEKIKVTLIWLLSSQFTLLLGFHYVHFDYAIKSPNSK